MRLIRRLLVIALVIFLIAIAWFWWSRPAKVDMAAYAPADSLVYLESNDPAEAASAIEQTDAWRSVAPYLGLAANRSSNRWLAYIARNTGIGSAKTVIATRSQVAIVMLDLNAVGSGDTLEYKPLAAIVVETHTSNFRIKPAVEQIVEEFARRLYGQPSLEHETIDGDELVKWLAPDRQRRIVACVYGTAVIVGNDERAVSACIAVRRGQRPSLLNQPGLNEMRARLQANSALAFGYVSSANAARLLSVATPLIFGKVQEGSQIERLVTNLGAKVLGSIGWSADFFSGSIEDRYLISLKSSVIDRLRSGLASAMAQHQLWDQLPSNTYSVTAYNLRDPAAAWDSLNAAVSSQADAVSAFFLSNFLRAILSQYGIDRPEIFLPALKTQILTVRLDQHSDRPLVLAAIRDEQALRQFVTAHFGAKPRTETVGDRQLFLSADAESAAVFVGDYLMFGSPGDVRRCLLAQVQRTTIGSSSAALKTFASYAREDVPAASVTYANDNERVRSLIATVRAVRGSQASSSLPPDAEEALAQVPYAVTATTLGADGVERRTRSPFGQFGTLLSLLAPDHPSSPGVNQP